MLTLTCAGRKPPQTMWSFGTMAGIQLLLFACGCPIGWEKFVSLRLLCLDYIANSLKSTVHA